MSGILPAASGMTTSAQQTDREKLHVVAKQFEAVFLREMLGAARKTSFGGDGGAGDISGGQAMDTFRQLQDEHFADATANSGAIGLAKLLEVQMSRFVADGSTDRKASGK
ncbi:rod-binding protein [Novosphingobium sp. Leaf2]|uniref:rod-binding protein n=1 Tax=Novosphingobium sp. Leaf2 TaxID=1735670 RepID=UPI0006F2CE88|nr:rod-binding protein [Novosphingobium sp. Leaf2]KQM14816.1 flagellar biosynthesis protein FlgJ [Novosphingobium sp. Leaf2]